VFFQKDGSLFQAEVEMTVARYLASAEDLDEFTLTQETGVATFLNESDGWRLFSYERRTAEDMPASAANWSGTIRGFNYYPAQTPWSEFWPSFDEAVVKADFDRIRALGGNSVRIFLTQNDFGSEEPGVPLRKLETLLALAERSGLSVVPTLFDLKQDYSLGTWADDSRFLDNVLPVLDASNTIAFVDIKNEPDLDFAHHGKAKVTAWLKTMAGLIRARAPELALTVGWAEAEQASVVSSDLDVITYHDYAPEAGVAARLAQVKDSAKGKPVVVTEIGESTFELAVNFPGSDTSQSIRLATRLDALEAADGVMLWTLNDFEKVDALAVGMSPWVRRSQAVFGVIRVDGSEKPAADIIRERWTGTADYPEG
jgi:endo-1,4-beta-mannosidase